MVNTFTAEGFIARNVEWDSGPAFDSTDPHLIPVPDDATPGLWRVCTVPDTRPVRRVRDHGRRCITAMHRSGRAGQGVDLSGRQDMLSP